MTKVMNLTTEENGGFDFDSIINIGSLREVGVVGEAASKKAVQLLEEHGWLMIDIADRNRPEQTKLIQSWRNTLSSAFEQQESVKSAIEKFHIDKGVSVGYKRDDTREFLETRLLQKKGTKEGSVGRSNDHDPSMETKKEEPSRTTDGLAGLLGQRGGSGVCVIPDCPNVPNYTETVKALFTVLSELGSIILSVLAESLGLDPSCLLDLTDLKTRDTYQRNARSNFYEKDAGSDSHKMSTKDLLSRGGRDIGRNCPHMSPDKVKPSAEGDYSASLLRVCRYAVDTNVRARDREIAFGAHTDTSFISIGLCAAEPGLEILDKKSYQWVCPENFDMREFVDRGDYIPRSCEDHEQPVVTADGESEGGKWSGYGAKRVAKQPMSPTVAVVFIGEFLQVLTGGKFSAAPHRVRCLSTVQQAHSASPSHALSLAQASVKSLVSPTASGKHFILQNVPFARSVTTLPSSTSSTTPVSRKGSMTALTDVPLSIRTIASSASAELGTPVKKPSKQADDDIVACAHAASRRASYSIAASLSEADVSEEESHYQALTQSLSSPMSLSGKYCDARVYKAVASTYRVSCPFLIRGRHDAIINIRSNSYNHCDWTILGGKGVEESGNENETSGAENNENGGVRTGQGGENDTSDSNDADGDGDDEEKNDSGVKRWIMPDLDGTSMLLVHRLLDMKRKRCASSHLEIDKDWVLSAYPVQPPAEPEPEMYVERERAMDNKAFL